MFTLGIPLKTGEFKDNMKDHLDWLDEEYEVDSDACVEFERNGKVYRVIRGQ